MKIRKLSAFVFLLLVVTSSGQTNRNSRRTVATQAGILAKQQNALGNRVSAAGKEQTIYIGEVFHADGQRAPAQVVHQQPALVRLEGFSPGRALTFDGERTAGIITKTDEAAVEVFTADLPEGLFASLQNGAALRHLGNAFGPDPRGMPNYSELRYDIFSTSGRRLTGGNSGLQSKLYYFDSETGLLQVTRYADESVPPRTQRETRFGSWRVIDGSAFPGRVEHHQDGRLLFSFTANLITSNRATEAGRFR